MLIHGIFSSYLGNDEFDVGKSVRWNKYFFDTEYIMDLSDGHRTRAYIVDWAASFPDVQSGYYQHTPTFFEPGGAAEWRRVSFEKGDTAWSYDDDDWICFVDCTEGMSCDDRINRFPTDPNALNPNLFLPWIEAEILVSANGQISLPIYVFVGNSSVWMEPHVIDQTLQDIIDTMTDEDIYRGLTKFELNMTNHSVSQECYQTWTRPGWSPRLFKVSTLRNSHFDWSKIDKFTATEPADAAQTGVSITSYAYARWAHDPSRINRLKTNPQLMWPMTEADDDGWRVRQEMSAVRPVPGLPFVSWSSADLADRTIDRSDPPPSVTVMNNAYSTAFDDSFANFDALVPTPAGNDWANWDYLQFLYPNVIRQNRREGLYFLEDEVGPVPWNFYTGQPALSAEQMAARADAQTTTQDRPLLPSQIPDHYVPPPVQTDPSFPNDTIHPVTVP